MVLPRIASFTVVEGTKFELQHLRLTLSFLFHAAAETLDSFYLPNVLLE